MFCRVVLACECNVCETSIARKKLVLSALSTRYPFCKDMQRSQKKQKVCLLYVSNVQCMGALHAVWAHHVQYGRTMCNMHTVELAQVALRFSPTLIEYWPSQLQVTISLSNLQPSLSACISIWYVFPCNSIWCMYSCGCYQQPLVLSVSSATSNTLIDKLTRCGLCNTLVFQVDICGQCA